MSEADEPTTVDKASMRLAELGAALSMAERLKRAGQDASGGLTWPEAGEAATGALLDMEARRSALAASEAARASVVENAEWWWREWQAAAQQAERMRPVVEAARGWRAEVARFVVAHGKPYEFGEPADALIAAVDALDGAP